jgi:hypothetical protein
VGRHATHRQFAPVACLTAVTGLTLVLAVSGCGQSGRQAALAASPSPATGSSPTVSPSASPSPSPTTPALWPTAVVAAMPAEMKAKYQTRLDSNKGDTSSYNPDRYFYYADTPEELPVQMCLKLSANSAPLFDQLPPEALVVQDRLRQWVKANPTTHVKVDANNSISDNADYAHHLAMDDDDLVNLSLTHLCPEMTALWTKLRPEVRAVADAEAAKNAERQYNETHPMVKFDDGRYTVGEQPRMIQPGTYHLPGPIRDCYWERSTGSGETIANNFITNAPSGVTVTLHAGEGFTSQGCTDSGRWERTG